MASFDDLGRALRDDAEANAPRASAINVDAVITAARARRRPRKWALGTLSIAAVLGLGGIAVATSAAPTLIAASESAQNDDLLFTSESAADESASGAPASRAGDRVAELLACGATAPTAAQAPPGLALELRVTPATLASSDAIDGVVVLTNSAAEVVTVTVETGAAAVGVLAQGDIIVGIGAVRGSARLEFQLGPGESRELPVRIPISPCESATDGPLSTGDYAAIALLGIAGSAPGTTELVVAPAADVRLD